LQPGLGVSGRVVVEGTAAPSWPLSGIRLSLSPDDVGAGLSTVSSAVLADGTFAASGLIPGAHRVNVTLPPTPDEPWAVKSAMLAGHDLLDEAVEIGGNTSDLVITVSNTLAAVSGQMSDADGRPVSRLYVLLFSTRPSDWRSGSRRIRDAQTTDTGAYAITRLPAGEYYLCALQELDLQMRYEPEYLEQLVPPAIKITLADGEKKVQNLRATGR